MRIALIVTHLLGSGHLVRAMTLADAFRAAGHEAFVFSGGMPLPRFRDRGDRLIQLPPLRSDGADFSRLLDESGQIVAPEALAQRQAVLLAKIAALRPDVLITELFPFGRRNLADEFQAVLTQERSRENRALVLASVRDILAPPSKPRKAVFAQDTLAAFYDGVLVHSDPALMPLDLSWPVTPPVAGLLRYTGFVTAPPAAPHPERLGRDEILVSAGGGNVGGSLYACARAAAALSPGLRWRLLVGGDAAGTLCADLNRDAPGNMHAEPARPDFRQMLHHARASVSLCGYNTALDILQTGCRAVFVPYDEGNEVEQTIRATALARQNGIAMVRAADLSPQALLQALETAIASPARPAQRDHMDGAARSVEIVEEMRRMADGR